jgi:hypothetical protein
MRAFTKWCCVGLGLKGIVLVARGTVGALGLRMQPSVFGSAGGGEGGGGAGGS